MNLTEQLDALLDATAFDSTGTKIGAVRQIYVDDASGKMTFATVSTGIFSADAIVPLHGARHLDNELHLDHTRSAIRDSPRPDRTEDGLTPDQEIRLLEYYGIEAPAREPETSTAAQAPTAKAGPATPASDTATTSGSASTDSAAAAGSPSAKSAAGPASTGAASGSAAARSGNGAGDSGAGTDRKLGDTSGEKSARKGDEAAGDETSARKGDEAAGEEVRGDESAGDDEPGDSAKDTKDAPGRD